MQKRSQKGYFYDVCLKIATNLMFGKFINFIILVNTFILAQDKFGINPEYEK